MTGKPKSPEHREKLRQANVGKKASPESRAKMSASHLANGYKGPWFGKKMPTELRQKMSEIRRRKVAEGNPGTEAANAAWRGAHQTEDAKRKISAGLKGIKRSPETIEKQKAAWVVRKQRKAERATKQS